jgi:hypothetical protein
MRDFMCFPHSGLPNTYSLRRLCIIFARPSHQHSYCGVVRPLLFRLTCTANVQKCLPHGCGTAGGTIYKVYKARRARNRPPYFSAHFILGAKALPKILKDLSIKIDEWLQFLLAKVRNIVRTSVEECLTKRAHARLYR